MIPHTVVFCFERRVTLSTPSTNLQFFALVGECIFISKHELPLTKSLRNKVNIHITLPLVLIDLAKCCFFPTELDSCPTSPMNDGTSPVVYILITAGIAIPLTAIFEGICVSVFCLWRKRKRKKNILLKYPPPPQNNYETKNTSDCEKKSLELTNVANFK